MKKIFVLFAVTFLFTINFSKAQFITGSEANAIVKNAETVVLINDDYLPSYIKFRAGDEIDLATVSSWLIDNFKLSQGFGLKLIKAEKDQIGYTHYRYQQTINGYPVHDGNYIAHVKNGKVVSLNGRMKKYVEPNTNFTLDETQALQKALSYVKASIYKWQISAEEKLIKYITGDSSATFYPKGELIIVPKKENTTSDEYRLAYKFDIYADQPMSRQYIFVDATTGEIIKTLNEIHTTNATASADTKYSGTRTIITDYTGSTYRLRETGRGLGIETYDMNVGTNYGSAVDFTNATTTWTGTNTYKDEVARDAHWGAEMTYDYYYSKFSRSSVDNAGYKLLSYVHSNLVGMGYSDNVNAFWDGTRMTYGDGDATYSPLTTLDICGHEITHGVTSNTANLDYQDESGAMNEGFSDIFGTCIEFYAKPPLATGNWTIGEQIGTAFRSMSSPNTYQQPDTYNGTYWYSGTSDNGGVHTNSGVLNFWFYLLCQGGSGTNDNSNAYSVTGITMTKAEQIAYRTLTYYLTNTSVYADARTYSIISCQDLYGSCGPEIQATTNAWYAVGIGAAYTSAAVSANFSADAQTFCVIPAAVQFTNTSSNATTYLWYFGDGTTSTATSPSHSYTTSGTFNVKLVAYGGTCGNDSLIQNSYITITLPSSPTTTGASRCGTGTVTLGASASSGTLEWFSAASGGSVINTGTSYTIPSLSTTTTYYVQDSIPGASHTCAKADNTGGGGYTSTGNHYLIFDCLTPVTLVSVKMYGNTTAPGSKTIALLNSAGTTLQSATVNVLSGLNTYTLNFSLPVATGLRLQCEGTNVYRNNAGVAFPYTTAGYISVTGTDAGATYYYYFYGWVIQEPGCTSARTPVVATINSTVAASVGITANPTGTICTGSSVTFTATPTNGGTTPSYQWQINGTNVNGATNSTYASSAIANNDVVTCILTSNASCVTGSPATSSPITMTVGSPATVSVTIAANPTGAICTGSSVTFTATPTNGGTSPSYQWKKNGTNINGATNSTYASGTLANNDVITCVLISNAGCITGSPATSGPITMTVNGPATASNSIAVSPTGTICTGTSVTFTATPTNGGTTPSYVWKKNGTTISGATNSTYTSSALANGDIITCVMTSNAGCITGSPATSNAITMVVTTAAAANVAITVNPTGAICSGSSVTFTATPANGGSPSYQWKKNGVIIGGATNATYSSSTLANTDAITCVMTSSLTCVTGSPATSNTITMTVNTPSAVTVGITVNPTGAICSGTSVTFTATPANGGTTPTYQWKNNGINISGATSSTYSTTTLANGDAITCVLTSNASCITGSPATSNTITMTVSSSLAAAVSIVSNPTGTICNGTGVTFTATPINGGTPSYQWKKNGAAISGATNSTYGSTTLANGDIITCVMTSNATCVTGSPATSNAITMVVTTAATAGVTITANPTGAICSGSSVTFTATPANGGSASYQWKKNGVIINGATNSTYSTSTLANTDAITCVMTSSLTCVTGSPATSNTITMTVNTPATATVGITVNPTGAICSGTSVTFTATPANGGTIPTYQWKNNGINISGATNSTYTSSTLANGNAITCVLTSNANCVTGSPATSNTITMTVNSSVAAAVSIISNPTGTICNGTGVTFTATPINGGTPSYQWKKNGATISGATNSTYSSSALVNGDIITCVMTSNAGCVTGSPATSNAITMSVSSALTASVSITANPATAVCPGTNITFTASPVNGGTSPVYQWQVNGSNVGAGSPVYSSSSLNNGDIVTCTMTSSATCVTVSTVNSNPSTVSIVSSVSASVLISATPGTNICSGTNTIFTATAYNGGGTPSYQWILNGNNVGSNSSTYSNSSLANNDVVSCIMTSSLSCSTNNPATSNSLTIHITTGLVAGVNITVNPNDTLCPGTLLTFNATAINGGTNPVYQWQVNGSNAGANSPVYSTSSLTDGNIISCLIISSLNCVSGNPATSNLITVTVQPVPTPFIILLNGDSLVSNQANGNQWYFNNYLGSTALSGATGQSYLAQSTGNYYTIVTDAFGCVSDTSNIIYVAINGINEITSSDISVYPNPTTGNIIIESSWNSSNPAEFEIFDVIGNKVFTGMITETKQNISLENLSQGIYMLRLKTNKSVLSKRIIIER